MCPDICLSVNASGRNKKSEADSLAGLLPEVDVFQVAHSSQSTQLQTLHSVPSHGQLVHCTQSLQHSRDVREVVEGEAQAIELGQATQLFRQRAEVVSIQRQRLQATRWRGENGHVLFSFTSKNGQNTCLCPFAVI